MEEALARKIEKERGKRIDVVLQEPDYRQETVGRYTIMVPYYQIRFKGEHRFVFVRGEVH